jgi:hypothetical protein
VIGGGGAEINNRSKAVPGAACCCGGYTPYIERYEHSHMCAHVHVRIYIHVDVGVERSGRCWLLVVVDGWWLAACLYMKLSSSSACAAIAS